MNSINKYLTPVVLISVAVLAGCSNGPAASADVTDSIRKSMELAGLPKVTVTQDRAKGLVTLGGSVGSESEKERAESVAKPLVAGQVLAMAIAVIPLGVEKEANEINSDIDKGIESNLNAALISNRLHETVKYGVTNAVVTLRGDVTSQETRALAEKVAASVPYVKQVVNTLQVRGQKATSTN